LRTLFGFAVIGLALAAALVAFFGLQIGSAGKEKGEVLGRLS
jgi:hypothetical protein